MILITNGNNPTGRLVVVLIDSNCVLINVECLTPLLFSSPTKITNTR